MSVFYSKKAQYQPPPRRLSAFPPIVESVIPTCTVVFLFQTFGGRLEQWLTQTMALWPLGGSATTYHRGFVQSIPHFEIWQLVTYSFLHGSEWHLLFNMFVFWMFGTVVERIWGSRRFLLYYLTCIVGAALVQLLVTYGSTSPTVGASGGVFGVLLAFGILFPDEKLLFLLFPIPVKAKYVVLSYGLVELILGITTQGSRIAHFAHLGGMLFGLILILFWRLTTSKPRGS